MQHTLRDFVCSTPSERRRYFERLLQIDELTALIERAVVGEARLKEFPRASAPEGRKYFDALVMTCHSKAGQQTVKEIEKAGEKVHTALTPKLLRIAKEEFGLDAMDLSAAELAIRRLQEEERSRQYPTLQQLRLRSDANAPDPSPLLATGDHLRTSLAARKATEKAAQSVSEAERLIANATSTLLEIGVITRSAKSDQVCPLCEDPRQTLSPGRLNVLLERVPLTSALQQAASQASVAERNWRTDLGNFIKQLDVLRIVLPAERDADAALLPLAVRPLAGAALKTAEALVSAVERVSKSVSEKESFIPITLRQDLERDLKSVSARLEEHSRTVASLERALGVGALANPEYATRAAWLQLAAHAYETAEQLKWEWALGKAQGLLSTIRKSLIEFRSAIIEGARKSFTDSMTNVWSLLRKDAGGKFSQITIPAAKGKGYKLEFEVKAILNDGSGDAEVDALRVFSESQINVVGIAAYVTRAVALDHKVLVFDDPVQSMDEDHFKSLADSLISRLVEEGRQVVVLTHSESFARDISHFHYHRASYATLRARYSRRKGCCVDEGSRRVAERLKAAEKLAEEGKLEEAWNRIRLALERLYTLAMKAATKDFNPDSWRSATAEAMWEQGAGAVITARFSESGPRLKDILKLSAKGAHDASASSATDIVRAVEYIRTLPGPLRVGSG
jgi:DNA repair exonuclease SbcCD ATPase subunit